MFLQYGADEISLKKAEKSKKRNDDLFSPRFLELVERQKRKWMKGQQKLKSFPFIVGDNKFQQRTL